MNNNNRQRYVLLSMDGRPAAFYSSEVNEDIPENAMEIDDATYEDLVVNQHTRMWDEEQFIECSKIAPTWAEIRDRRTNLLSASDWTQLPDNPLSSQKRDEWAVYRQALRDITESFTDPADVVWPGEPA